LVKVGRRSGVGTEVKVGCGSAKGRLKNTARGRWEKEAGRIAERPKAFVVVARRDGGTNKFEEIRDLAGQDEITDGFGKDFVYGGDDSVDRFYGGAGDDTVQSRDVPAAKDRVHADEADVVSSDCERLRAW
jgi:hypothetical protein